LIVNGIVLASDVDVYLPKFKIESTHGRLIDILQDEFGLRDIFNIDRANFPVIAAQGVYVSKVIQKAVIEVNEEGAEASVAAGMAELVVAYLLYLTKLSFELIDHSCTQ
jgi:serpin B